MKSLFLTLFLFLSYNVAAQKTYVFFGSFNWDKDTDGIYIYNLDTIQGSLTKVSSIKNAKNPSYITLSDNGKMLYTCTDSKTPNAGSVSSFKFNPENGILSYLNQESSHGENPVYVSVHPNGKWLVTANYTESSISLYPINTNGSIGEINKSLQYHIGSNKSLRQKKSHMHSAIFSQNGNYLLSADLGADKIRVYTFNTKSAQPLAEKDIINSPPRSGPRHLRFHPNGKWLYSIEEISGSISIYNYKDGKLIEIQRILNHPNDYYAEDYESSDIQISPDGKFLYATNRGKENNISIFNIAKNGTLTLIGYEKVRGLHPRTFAIDPTGNFLIVANVNSNAATVFKRDKNTGMLNYINEINNLPHVSSVQIKSYR